MKFRNKIYPAFLFPFSIYRRVFVMSSYHNPFILVDSSIQLFEQVYLNLRMSQEARLIRIYIVCFFVKKLK